MERIKVSCYVDASNLRSILNLPELKDNGVSGSDLDGVSEIILDPPTLPLEDDNQRTQFVNNFRCCYHDYNSMEKSAKGKYYER